MRAGDGDQEPQSPPPGPEEVPTAPPPETPPPNVPPEIVPPGEQPLEIPEPPPESGVARLRVSPAARRRARELGVDLSQLTGSGPGGVVTLADVDARTPVSEVAERKPARRGIDPAAMRQAIGAAMARSKREIPHYYLAHTIDMAPALAWLEQANLKRPVTSRLLYGVLLLRAVALALLRFPEFNGFWSEGRFVSATGVHAGWAIALRGGGLIAPAVRDADRRSVDELMISLRDLVKRARAGGLRSSELSDPTITVTSLGEQGVETVQPVIYPPQVAIVGFGSIIRRPWVDEDERIMSRPLISASLAADHRVSDGHRGAAFLASIARHLEDFEAP